MDHVQQLALGSTHTCALKTDDTVWCWGDNRYGQSASAADSVPVPQQVPNVSATTLTAGAQHTCAATVAYNFPTVLCWGDNFHYQAGLLNLKGTLTAQPQAVTQLRGTVIALAAGESHTCAMFEGGTRRCWGNNAAGQLGIGRTTQYASLPQDLRGNIITTGVWLFTFSSDQLVTQNQEITVQIAIQLNQQKFDTALLYFDFEPQTIAVLAVDTTDPLYFQTTSVIDNEHGMLDIKVDANSANLSMGGTIVVANVHLRVLSANFSSALSISDTYPRRTDVLLKQVSILVGHDFGAVLSANQTTGFYVFAFDNLPSAPFDLTTNYWPALYSLQAGTRNNPNFTAVVLADLHGDADTHILSIRNGLITEYQGLPLAPPGLNQPDYWNGFWLDETRTEISTNDYQELANFLIWAYHNFPAQRTMFSYIGHGNPLNLADPNYIPDLSTAAAQGSGAGGNVGVNPSWIGVNPSWIGVNPSWIGVNPSWIGVNPSWIGVNPVTAVTDLHPTPSNSDAQMLYQTLAKYYTAIQRPIDLVDMAFCFGMNLNVLLPFGMNDGLAKVILSSPNYLFFDPKMLGNAISALSRDANSQIAYTVGDAYTSSLPAENHPYVLTAINGAATRDLSNATMNFDRALATTLLADPIKAHNKLQIAYQNSQKYDASCTTDLNLADPDAFSDVADFTRAVANQFYDDSVLVDAALTLQQASQNAVLKKWQRDGHPWFAPDDVYWHFEGTGIAMLTDLGERLVNGNYVIAPITANSIDMPYQWNWNKAYWGDRPLAVDGCLPTMLPLQQTAELSVSAITQPFIGEVRAGQPVTPSALLTIDREALNPTVVFVISQDDQPVFVDIINAGYFDQAGTYVVNASRPWVPVAGSPVTITAIVDPYQAFIDQHLADNKLSRSETVLPSQSTPDFFAALANQQEWFQTSNNISLYISPKLNNNAPMPDHLVIQAYQYPASQNTGQLLATETLPFYHWGNFNYILPQQAQTGLLILKIWGESNGIRTAEPLTVDLNYAPGVLTLSSGGTHLFRVSASRGQVIDLSVLPAIAQNADVFVWLPNQFGQPALNSTLQGSDRINFIANLSGQYWIMVRGDENVPTPVHYQLRIGTDQNEFISTSFPDLSSTIPQITTNVTLPTLASDINIHPQAPTAQSNHTIFLPLLAR
jgi:hypothetical protein